MASFTCGFPAVFGQGVEPPAGPVFACRNRRILPAAPKQAHFFEPTEGAIERPVRGEQPLIVFLAQVFGDFVAVEFAVAGTRQLGGGDTNRRFERHQAPGLSAHARIISRYMRICPDDILRRMKRPSQAVWLCLVIAAGVLATNTVTRAAAIDDAFRKFWDARSPQDAAKVVSDIVSSGVSFDEAQQRLKTGRTYSADVRKGVIRTSHVLNGVEYFYAVTVPDTYDPVRRYQVRIHLHGGVGRESNGPRGDGTIGALAGAEQIYLIPYSWRDAPWWDDEQLANLRTILDRVKRTYNVDENRVAVAGVSDGGTGAYYIAMRDATPYSSFLPLNGFMMVLRSVVDTGLFPNNLRNKPFFVVNGGRDQLYPTRIVEPYVDHLRRGGVELEYRPQPNGAHNTAWWPEVKDAFEQFVRDHPRNPLPTTLTWETDASPVANRIDWLVVDRLSPRNRTAPARTQPDVNVAGLNGDRLFDNVDPSGRIDLVRSGNTVAATTTGVAEFTLLLSPDAFDFDKPVRVEANGRVAFEGRVARSLETLITWAARDNDRTMLFGAELHVKVQ